MSRQYRYEQIKGLYMSIMHKRDKGAGTTQRQNRRKPQIIEQAPVETVTEPTADVTIADMSMKKAELVEIAELMGLSTKGSKKALIKRIQA
jgi:hypothetical protein